MNTKGHCYPRSIILQEVYFKDLILRDAREPIYEFM